MSDIDIYTKLASLPDKMKSQVDDFVDFLMSKGTVEKKVSSPRKAGLAKGLIQMKDDFDEPLDDFKDYME